jgi:hypothetical protein
MKLNAFYFDSTNMYMVHVVAIIVLFMHRFWMLELKAGFISKDIHDKR